MWWHSWNFHIDKLHTYGIGLCSIYYIQNLVDTYIKKKKTYNIKEMDIFSSEELLMIVEILNEE